MTMQTLAPAAAVAGYPVVGCDHQVPRGHINALNAALQQVAAKAQLGVVIGFLAQYVRSHSLAKQTPAGEPDTRLSS